MYNGKCRPQSDYTQHPENQGAAAEACIKFLVSKDDSKMERDAKTALDEVFEGDVNHAEVCKWVFS